jgi:hypothetical protein
VESDCVDDDRVCMKTEKCGEQEMFERVVEVDADYL